MSDVQMETLNLGGVYIPKGADPWCEDTADVMVKIIGINPNVEHVECIIGNQKKSTIMTWARLYNGYLYIPPMDN